jgi:hypothetical protein
MYGLVLTLHSILRWAVLIVGLAAIIRAFVGWFGNRGWEQLDERLGLIYTSVMDLQLLLGLLLYFVLSPLTRAALQDFGGAMANSVLRFWSVEHLLLMIIAVILAHLGRSLSRRTEAAKGKHQRAAILFTLSLLAVLITIPWPFMANFADRPWIRLGL